MGLIDVEDVEPGMVLADDVVSNRQMMLLPAGSTINENHLVTFMTWGITQVCVVGESTENDDNTMTEEERQELIREVTEIFKFNNVKGTFTNELFKIACSTRGAP